MDIFAFAHTCSTDIHVLTLLAYMCLLYWHTCAYPTGVHVQVMIAALRQLGVPRIDFEDHGHTLVIQGAAGQLKPAGDQPVSEAGLDWDRLG